MYAGDVLSEMDMVTLDNWFGMEYTHNKAEECDHLSKIRDKLSIDCSKYYGSYVYRGVFLSMGNTYDITKKLFVQGSITPENKCDSWTGDFDVAVSVAKFGSVSKKYRKQYKKKAPHSRVGLVFERKTEEKSCVFPVPVLFDLDWSKERDAYQQMIKNELHMEEDEFIMAARPMKLEDLVFMNITSNAREQELSSTLKLVVEHLKFNATLAEQFVANYASSHLHWIDLFLKNKRIIENRISGDTYNAKRISIR